MPLLPRSEAVCGNAIVFKISHWKLETEPPWTSAQKMISMNGIIRIPHRLTAAQQALSPIEFAEALARAEMLAARGIRDPLFPHLAI